MNPTHHVWLLRHGQSESNAGQPVDSPESPKITDFGRRQALLAAQALPEAPDHVIVSRYVRSQETAEPILERFPQAQREIWNTREYTYLAPERYHGATAEDRKPARDDYWRRLDPAFVDGPGAESFNGFVIRLQDCLRRLGELPGNGVLVGHGQHLRGLLLLALFPQILDAPDEKRMRHFLAWRGAFPWPNGAWVRLGFRDGRAVQIDPLESAHLGELISQ